MDAKQEKVLQDTLRQMDDAAAIGLQACADQAEALRAALAVVEQSRVMIRAKGRYNTEQATIKLAGLLGIELKAYEPEPAADDVAARVRSCLVCWRCVSCRHDLIEMPEDIFGACPACGVKSVMHQVFSIDEGGLIEIAKSAGQAQPVAVPDGWHLVPVEPTREMVDAYLQVTNRFHSAKSDWAAMLAAAPPPAILACDTPNYCRSAQRCTAMDESRAKPSPAAEGAKAARADFRASFPLAFVTTQSGGGDYKLVLSFGTMDEMHRAHRFILGIGEPAEGAKVADLLSAANPPFDNCRYRICDLPGQCRGEGKCHHPAIERAVLAQPKERIALSPMAKEDGRAGYYFSCPELYIDVEPESGGNWSVYVRDKKADKDQLQEFTSLAQPSAGDERAAFEAWATAHNLISVSHGIRSEHSLIELMRSAWQAGRAALAQQQGRDAEDAKRWREARRTGVATWNGVGDKRRLCVKYNERADEAIDAAIAASTKGGEA